MIDHDLAVRPHGCAPPRDIFHIEGSMALDAPSDDPPRLVWVHPPGTRFHCDDCGRVWVVTRVPGYVGARVVAMDSWQWRPETKTQRRERLGLRWWQRGR